MDPTRATEWGSITGDLAQGLLYRTDPRALFVATITPHVFTKNKWGARGTA